jgi:molybdopterin-guanine dinucleotide biosynthesis protein
MAAPDKFALIMRWSDELGPEEIATRYMSEADIVICEGFKRSALPKIEIHRREAHPSPLLGGTEVQPSTYRALVTDDDRVETALPVIRLDIDGWLERLADFVEGTIIDRSAGRGAIV